jgi:hypothetical protein
MRSMIGSGCVVGEPETETKRSGEVVGGADVRVGVAEDASDRPAGIFTCSAQEMLKLATDRTVAASIIRDENGVIKVAWTWGNVTRTRTNDRGCDHTNPTLRRTSGVHIIHAS